MPIMSCISERNLFRFWWCL